MQASEADTYYFPPGVSAGTYLLTYQCAFTNAGEAPDYAVATTNCTAKNLINNNASALSENNGTAGVTTGNFCCFVTIERANASFTVTGQSASGPTVIVWADFFVTQIPSVIN